MSRERVVKGWRVVRRLPDGKAKKVGRLFGSAETAEHVARLMRLYGDTEAIYDVEPINGYDDAVGIANVG